MNTFILGLVVGLVVGGIAGYYYTNSSGTNKLLLEPILNNYSTIPLNDAKIESSDFKSKIQQPNSIQNFGVSFSNKALLSFLGTVHTACENKLPQNAELFSNFHFSMKVDSVKGIKTLNLVLVPAYIPSGGVLTEFNGFDNNNQPIDNATGTNEIQLMNKGTFMPPPLNGVL